MLIVCPQGMEYVLSFFGCLYAGLVAVPAYAPRNNHHFGRLRRIIEDSAPSMVLLCREQMASVRALLEVDECLKSIPLVAVDDILAEFDVDPAPDWTVPALVSEDLAFLQYTSGSTGAAKGVMVTHGNLLANEEMIHVAFGNHSDSRAVSWLPLFHDMGLMTLLQGVHAGYSTWLMRPMDFLSDPSRWLQTISRVRATLTAAPNFAWQLCVEKITPAQIAALDLSSLEVAVSGSEPISPATLKAFHDTFAPAGFRNEAFRPSYGLAETTLLVTASAGLRQDSIIACPIASTEGHERVHHRILCGRPAPGCEVRVVDRDTCMPVDDGEVGEIWVKGSHVAAGYWKNPQLTAETFANVTAAGDGPFLRTGDLGFLHQGELVVAGRCKDIIILRGENFYPSDLEGSALSAHDRLVPDCAAAFTLQPDTDADGTDAASRLCLVAEVRRGTREEDYPRIAQAIVGRISETYGLALERIVLIRERSIPKTSSGKVQRAATRDALGRGELKVLWEQRASAAADGTSTGVAGELLSLIASGAEGRRRDMVESCLLGLIAEALNVPLTAIDQSQPIGALGLDSLALMNLKARIWNALNVDLPADALFGDMTLAVLVDRVDALVQDALSPADATPAIAASVDAVPTCSGVSAGQLALWMTQQTDSASNAYNEGFVARVSGRFEPEAFLGALRELQVRHDALQMVFAEAGDRVAAARGEALDCRIERFTSDAAALGAAQDAFGHPFDLARGTWRSVVAVGPSETHVALVFHHIVVDMRSLSVLIDELKQLYGEIVHGGDVACSRRHGAATYAAHVAWQNEWLRSDASGRQLDYWRERLHGMPLRSSLPIASALRSRPLASEHRFEIDADTVTVAKRFAARTGTTLYQVLFAACSLLLSRYSGQRDIVVGMPTLGRSRSVDAATVGYFTNVLPVRLEHPEGLELTTWIERAKEAVAGGLCHQDLPLLVLDEHLARDRGQAERSDRGTPLLQVVLSLLSAEASATPDSGGADDHAAPFVFGQDGGRLAMGDAVLASVDPARPRAQFELSIVLMEEEGGLRACAGYRGDLFPAGLIERFCANFPWIVGEIACGAHSRLRDIPSMHPGELGIVARGLRGSESPATLADEGEWTTVVDWFRRAAASTPAATALRDARTTLSYEALDRQSDALAAHLIVRGIVPGQLVALATRSRLQQAKMAIAVAKAGAAYLPVDLANPADRVAFMLRDSGAALVISTQDDVGSLPNTGIETILADGPAATPVAVQAGGGGRPRVAVNAGDLAYCIYTSGSTGQPKGVLVSHAALKNLVLWHLQAFEVDHRATATLLAGPGFDASVLELWPYLCTGATLLEPLPECRRDMLMLADWLQRTGASHCFMPTPMVEAFLTHIGDEGAGTALRYLYTGGDQLKTRPRSTAGFRLLNIYGPAENAVATTCGEVLPADACAPGDATNLPDIGRPIRGQELHILDDVLRPVPLGVTGDLHIRCPELVCGYRNRPALTAERFLPDPHARDPGARMYATGDVVRLDEANRIQFVGRNDDQIQIRGCRVEIGEVEAAITAHPHVHACKVTVTDSADMGKMLVAYVVADGALDDAALRTQLAGTLPAYMVPSAIVLLDELVLDANGKISRQQTRVPATRENDGGSIIYADRWEREVSAIFQEVLSCRQVRPEDDFFFLGGHSMMVHVVVAAIRERLRVRVAIADVFANPRVRSLAAHLRAQQDAPAPLRPAVRPERLPLSGEQRRLWLQQQLDGDSTDYNICVAMRIHGAVDRERLQVALARVAAKHESLRTVFASEEGVPWQRILPPGPVALEWSAAEGGGAELERAVDDWAGQRFDLQHGPLFKARFLDAGGGEGVLAFCLHHIVADGRSMEVLFEDICRYYEGGDAAEGDVELLQYSDYCLWRRTAQLLDREAASLAYWRETLSGDLPGGLASIAGADVQAAGEAANAGEESERVLSAAQAGRVREFALRHGVTESTVYLAVYGLLVSKYTGQHDVLLGMAYDGRELPEFRNTVGMFVNVLPIRATFRDGDPFRVQVLQLRDACVTALRHGSVDYARLVEMVDPARRSGAGELVHNMFDFEQIGQLPAKLGNAGIEVLRRPDRSAKFEATLRCSATADGGMRLSLNHRRAQMTPAFAARFLEANLPVIDQVLADPNLMPPDVRLVDDAQAERLLRMGRGAVVPLPDTPAVRLFERLADEHPQWLALADAAGEHLSYAEANMRANRVARHLLALGARAGDAVALCMSPGNPFAICALAVMKIGAAYVPVDPHYPEQRKSRILASCGATLAIIDADGALDSAADRCAIQQWSQLCASSAALPPDNIAARIGMDDLAYVVYTSGTTGQPKGIEIPQRGLANLCHWHAAAYGLQGRNGTVRASQTAGIGFDAAVWELWPYLTTGGSVWFAPDDVRQSSPRLAAWLTANGITHAFLSTPLAHAVLADGWSGSPDLEYLLTGGERLTSRPPAGSRYLLVNHYGPSENSVVATAGAVEASTSGDLPSIGCAIDNVNLYVLDRHGRLLPQGVPGELHIGGMSLMRGYRGDHGLTERMLVVDSFDNAPPARMYRSGDIVRWNDEGQLQYVGRADEQVKIRGFRIELGEILRAIKASPDVRDAVVTVITHERQGMQIVAHVVFTDAETSDGLTGTSDRQRADGLKAALATDLPGFMVPAFIVPVDVMPLTSNGKVDHARLPAPQRLDDAPPSPLDTPTEHELAAIWSELLGEPVANTNANFFALGGQSLLASRAVAMIGTRLKREVALKDFFVARDLADLARRIDAAASYDRIPVAPADAVVPLSPYQKRLWLTQSFNRASVDYNVIGAVRVTGPLDPEAFHAALMRLVTRHAILRTRIVDAGGEPCQELLPPLDATGEKWPLNLLQLNLSGNSPETQDGFIRDSLERMAKEPFDLASGSLFKIVVIQTTPDCAVLAVSFHHIIVDAWSANVFMRELFGTLAAMAEARDPQFAELPLQYRDYSLWAHAELERSRDALQAFWRRYLADVPAPTQLPTARANANVHKRTPAKAQVTLSAETLDRLKAIARGHQASLYEVLISSHFIWLHRLSGQTDFVVGTPYNDRSRAELANLIGFFVNTLPIRGRVAPHQRFGDLVRRTRTDLAEIYGHPQLPFDELVERCTDATSVLFQTMFDFQPELAAYDTQGADGQLRAEVLDSAPEAPVAELSVTFRETSSGLVLSCVYVAETFEVGTVARWLENYRILLESIAADGGCPVRQLAFLTPREQAVVDHWRNNAPIDGRSSLHPQWRDGETEDLLHVLVDRQAVLSPSRIALCTDDAEISYAELAAHGNRLANLLLDAGVRSGTVVGVEAVHSIDAVIGIIAIMKAGAICFPIDPRQPDERIAFLLEDSGCAYLLAGEGFAPAGFGGRIIPLDASAWTHAPATSPAVNVTPDYGVFLTYTSGTTGVPKGAVLHHRGIINYVGNVVERLGYSPSDRGLLFAPLTFDASLEEIFAPLCLGASLYIGDEHMKRSVPALLETCHRHGITVLTLPTAYWRVLSEHLSGHEADSRPLGAVRLVSIGGEKMTIEATRRWHRATAGSVDLFNIYGPSECSVGSIVDRVDLDGVFAAGEIYLHHPIVNAELHLLDAHLSPVPAESAGELYIGGAGVGHGYHQRPALTAQRFVPDPFSATVGARMYRTGDLASYDLDGRLQFIGRVDFQIKVDGIRLEPEEIESALEGHQDVAQAIVLARPDPAGRVRLTGYATLKLHNRAADGKALVAYLRERLPAHMVPGRIIVLDAFPLTRNQKVDRRALPEIDDIAPVATTPALSPTESGVLALWRMLLAEDSLGLDDNFFELGGSSLLAIRINSRIEDEFGVRLSAAAVFEQPTVRMLSALIDGLRAEDGSAACGAAPSRVERIERIEDTSLPLSGAQYRLWYLHQRFPDNTAYHLPDLLALRGALHRTALAKAIEAGVAEHESLRTRFVIEGDAPVQVIDPAAAVAVDEHDLVGLDGEVRARAFSALVRQACETPFDLAQGPLARFTLIRRAADEHILLSTFHHIVIDGWSTVLFQHTVARHYNALVGGGPGLDRADGAQRQLQYRDFAAWHRRLLDGGELERQSAYWMNQLGGELPRLQLPTDHARPQEPSGEGAAFAFELDAALAAQLQRLGDGCGASLFMVLLAAYAALLARYATQEDLIIGVPTMGRARPELESIVGFFVNTLAIRARTSPQLVFSSLLDQVRRSCLEAFDHQDISLAEVAARVNDSREHDGRGLFQTMFSFQDADALNAPAFAGLVAESIEPEHRTAKFDLYLATWRLDGRLHCGFEYSTDLFDEATVRGMADHFRNLLAGIVATPEAALRALPLLGAKEFEHRVHGLNGNAMALPERQYFRDLFAFQAARHPDRIVVSMDSYSMTYAELDAASTRVARNLLSHGAEREDIVGLMLGRNVHYLIAMLGVLKAGVAFTPMNPEDPAAKLHEIVELANVRYLVCEAETLGRAGGVASRVQLCEMEALLGDPCADAPTFLPLLPSSLAYVIYTSGSTGLPKGAMIEQRGMLNHLLAKVRDLGLDENDVVAETAVTTFDVSVWQYLVALLVGGRTVVVPGDSAWDPQPLLTHLDTAGVTVFESVPSHMKILIDELEARPGHYPLERLRVYISNAEALPPALCDRWFKLLPHIPMINTYGATECSDDTSHLWIREPLHTTLPYVPIQGTLPNLNTYLLDTYLQPVPQGVTGEVYLGGTGVGRGYLGDAKRTAAVFLPDPFSPEPGSRLYKTGDLARYRLGDVLEFVGREDFQVKIRGQRVEIGEVEKAACAHDNVQQAVVVAQQDGKGRLYLLGYVVPHRHPAPTSAELRAFVVGRIAAYMVPAAFVMMDAFPLSANGKVDRTRLPKPDDQDIYNRNEYVEPATPTEQRLAALWQELLEVDRVGALDSFLELGGHSLLAAELVLKIRTQFSATLPVRVLFTTPQLHDVARAIDDAQEQSVAALPARVERLPAEDRYELAPCQIPEWYAYQMEPTSPVYNVSLADLFFTGALDRAAFIHAWNTIIERHEIMRVRFGYEDGRAVQFASPRMTLDPAQVFIDRTWLSGADAIAEANLFGGELGVAPFDFERGPLFRLHVVSYAGDFHQLIFVVHHIVWDETSLMNLMQELSELYNARIAGRPANVPELEVSYFDYVRWMHGQLRSGAFDAHRDYWLDAYREPPQPLNLPTDYPRPDMMSYRGGAISSWLPRNVVRKIQTFLKRNDVTLFQLQLAVIDQYLARISGQNDFVIGCPIAGRADERLNPLLGLFATPMPIRCNVEEGMTFRDLLHQVTGRTLDAFEHYHYPANQVIEQLQHQKDLSRPKLFSIMFGVQNNKTDLMSRLQFDGLTISIEDVVDTENKSSRFDLNFVVDQFGSDIMFSCIYNADLFHPSSIDTMLENMAALMDEVLDDPDLPLHRYTMLGMAGSDGAVVHGEAVPCRADDTMHSLMARQAAATPQWIAVVAEGRVHGYAELDAQSNRLAHYLLSMGVRTGDRVVVMMAPGFDLIVSLYAILKAGGCFVPLGTQHPQKRVDAILRATKARCALTHTRYRCAFDAFPHDVLCFDEIVGALGGYSEAALPPVDPSLSAYILYTSGSTGTPKGIEIEHRSVANMLVDIQSAYKLGGDDCVLFHTPYTFDVFIQDVFWPLSAGARVAVMGNDLDKSAIGMASIIERENVTLLQFVPLMLDAFVEAREQGRTPALPSLRQVICGAAALYRGLAGRFANAFDCALANHYGPTEVTVDACRFDCAEAFVGDTVPIGRPIGNSSIYLLDEHLQPVPRGIIGEILVASPGLARGYVGDQEGTARAFIDYQTGDTQVRLYRTGDLGRCDRDGVIHFHGRRDAQFKIRGNRVELEEIASDLRSHPGIASAAIRYREDGAGNGRLVAYVQQTAAVQQEFLPGLAEPVYFFTLEQRPELYTSAATLTDVGDANGVRLQAFAALATQFPAFQWMLTDRNDALLACGAGLPVRLADFAAAGVTTMDDAIRIADAQRRDGILPDALLAFEDAATMVQGLTLDAAAVERVYRRLAVFTGLSVVAWSGGGGGGDAVRASAGEVCRGGLTRTAVRDWLRQSLPDYMIPDIVHFIPEVPMTDSGKVDTKRLPYFENVEHMEKQLASTDLQIELARVWESLLKVEGIGVDDDFFVLGGQSLKAIELVSEVNRRYGAKVQLRDFYRNPTILGLEKLVGGRHNVSNGPASAVDSNVTAAGSRQSTESRT